MRIAFFLLVLAAASMAHGVEQRVIPGPVGSELFGASITYLPNGNLVVIDPYFDLEDGTQNAGAVWIYRPDGSLLSRLTGAFAGDLLGNEEATRTGSKVWLLSGSRFLVRSRWNNRAGSVTFIDGDVGLNGVVSASNSLVGASPDDTIGTRLANDGITVLPGGNYVVNSPEWDAPGVVNAGAVTFGSGTTGVSGVVSAANSLVGSRANDFVGEQVVALTNGNYVVASPRWDRVVNEAVLLNASAVTWSSATNPVVGPVSETNSLVTDNSPGAFSPLISITPLSQGNYVIGMPSWRNVLLSLANVGAVRWASGTVSVTGVLAADNAVTGSAAEDQVGQTIVALADGNYVIASRKVNGNRGAVRWASGTAPALGTLDASNSLVGATASDSVSSGGVQALPSGAYLVLSPLWDRGAVNAAGALSFGPAGAGLSGVIDAANSLVGVRSFDIAGEVRTRVAILGTGHYVYAAEDWDNGTLVDAGAAVFGNGQTGVVGEISAANALIGSSAGDLVGSTTLASGTSGIVPLSNGHYVVNSNSWDNGAIANVGAATWGDGVNGSTGVIGASNSLIGVRNGHGVGGTLPLTNGNYVVRSNNRESGMGTLGAATWCDGSGPTSAVLGIGNSLMGSAFNDGVAHRLTALPNGHYVVSSWDWNDGARARVGAITWGDGTTGVTGLVSSANSLIGGRAQDRIGLTQFAIGPGAIALPDGNYVVPSQYAVIDMTLGAVTVASGDGGLTGLIDADSSALGGIETGNFTVRIDYDSASRTLAVGQGGQNRVVLLRLIDAEIFSDGFE